MEKNKKVVDPFGGAAELLAFLRKWINEEKLARKEIKEGKRIGVPMNFWGMMARDMISVPKDWGLTEEAVDWIVKPHIKKEKKK